LILGASEVIWLWQSSPLRKVLENADLVLRVPLHNTTSTRHG